MKCSASVNVSHKVSGQGFGYGTQECDLEEGHAGFHRLGQVSWADARSRLEPVPASPARPTDRNMSNKDKIRKWMANNGEDEPFDELLSQPSPAQISDEHKLGNIYDALAESLITHPPTDEEIAREDGFIEGCKAGQNGHSVYLDGIPTRKQPLIKDDGTLGEIRKRLTETAIAYGERKGHERPDINDLYSAAVSIIASLSSATQPTESAEQAYERGQRTMLHRVNSILKEHGEKGFLLSNQKYFPPPAPKGGS